MTCERYNMIKNGRVFMPHQTHFKLEDIQKFLIHHFGLNTLDTYGSQKDGIMNYLKRFVPFNMIRLIS